MKFKRTFRKAVFKITTWLIRTTVRATDSLAYTGRTIGRAIKATTLLIKKAISGFFRWLGLIFDDILLMAGIGFLFYGIRQIYEPAAFIFLGLSLMGLAYLVAHKREIKKLRR